MADRPLAETATGDEQAPSCRSMGRHIGLVCNFPAITEGSVVHCPGSPHHKRGQTSKILLLARWNRRFPVPASPAVKPTASRPGATPALLWLAAGGVSQSLRALLFASLRHPKPQGSSYKATQRAQHPLIKEYTLNYKGLHIMI